MLDSTEVSPDLAERCVVRLDRTKVEWTSEAESVTAIGSCDDSTAMVF